MYRDPKDIDVRGVSLAERLERHAKWLRSEDGGDRASLDGARLYRASLDGASLDGARLDGASLNGVRGNMRQIKSAQFDTWAIAWTRSSDGVTMLQIACQRHDLELWRQSDPRWIAEMDDGAAEWWTRYRGVILALVDASPAVPYVKKD